VSHSFDSPTFKELFFADYKIIDVYYGEIRNTENIKNKNITLNITMKILLAYWCVI
jgi:hypothetical protein